MAKPKLKPRAGRKGARTAGYGRPWTTVQLRQDATTERQLLDLEQKSDSDDASRQLVRAGQFSDSFMMATNGGATYEDWLRPGTLKAVPATPATAIRERFRRSGLHNVLGDSDDRVRIDDTLRIPARSIGLLKIMPEDGEERYGTAWLIGPRTLATAAHNLIHPEAGPTVSLQVGLAFDGSSARGDWHKVIDNAFPGAWKESPSPDNPNDFAVLKIANAAVGNKLGWFGFANYDDGKFENMIVNIFGYPMDVESPFHMYGSAGRIISRQERRIFYDCDAGGGMSGGPVVARFDQQRIAVGIHIAGGDATNVATRITAPAYDMFERHKSW